MPSKAFWFISSLDLHWCPSRGSAHILNVAATSKAYSDASVPLYRGRVAVCKYIESVDSNAKSNSILAPSAITEYHKNTFISALKHCCCVDGRPK